MIYLVARIHIKPGALEAFAAIAQPCIEATRREPGCVHYDLHASITDPETVVFVEQWESREALDAHFRTPHLAAFRKASREHVVTSRVEVIHPEHVEVL